MDGRAEKIINSMQTLTDELVKHIKHPDELVTVNTLQEDLHKVRQAFETQINNDELLDRKD